MTSKRILSTLLPVALLAVMSCSKTQDTAPERRIFGSPPTIQTVTSSITTQSRVSCDFTIVAYGLFCNGGFVDIQPQTGRGWTIGGTDSQGNHIIVYSDVPTTDPGVFIEGSYTELTLIAQVSDPESTPQQNNVLLVSASFQPADSKNESTLVLFDDGSQVNFPIEQRATVQEDCSVDVSQQICGPCAGAIFNVKSGDLQKGDSTFARKLAFVNNTTSGFLQDCILDSQKSGGHEEVPIFTPAGTTFQFKIEAVDRQGNLATWPTKVTATTGHDTFVCNGDSCGCCMLHAQSNPPLADIFECYGLDGMVSPSRAPDGWCKDCLFGCP